MADAKSNYAENLVLQWLLTANSVTRPTTWYIGLFTTDTGEAGAGTEVNGGSYARQPTDFVVTDNAASPDDTLTFTGLPAATITHFGVFTAVSGGNLLYYGALTAPKEVESGDSAQFTPANLTINEL